MFCKIYFKVNYKIILHTSFGKYSRPPLHVSKAANGWSNLIYTLINLIIVSMVLQSRKADLNCCSASLTKPKV